MNNKPTRCINPVMKYCQECKYGLVEYPEWVETVDDLKGCCFEYSCVYGLENTKPTKEEIEEFNRWVESFYDKESLIL